MASDHGEVSTKYNSRRSETMLLSSHSSQRAFTSRFMYNRQVGNQFEFIGVSVLKWYGFLWTFEAIS